MDGERHKRQKGRRRVGGGLERERRHTVEAQNRQREERERVREDRER